MEGGVKTQLQDWICATVGTIDGPDLTFRPTSETPLTSYREFLETLLPFSEESHILSRAVLELLLAVDRLTRLLLGRDLAYGESGEGAVSKSLLCHPSRSSSVLRPGFSSGAT